MSTTLILTLLLIGTPAEKETAAPRTVPLSRALASVWPGQPLEVEMVELEMKGELRRKIAKRCRSLVPTDPVRLLRIRDESSQLLGHAVVLDEIGKYRPITFLVSIGIDGKVRDLQVLVYREHIGQQIESARFTRQFRGKAVDQEIRLHREIRNLAGATLSARASVRAVRRALATLEEGKKSTTRLPWLPLPGKDDDAQDVSSATTPGPLPPASVIQARPSMGTVLRIEVYGPSAQVAVEAAFTEVERIESLLSRWREESDIRRVERAQVGEPVEVSEDTIECVMAALEAARHSEGAFDPTLVSGGYRCIVVDPVDKTITLLRDDLIIDLGGIGKGYALDRAGALLRRLGNSSALLDYGGQILALDPPPGESAWQVALVDPRDDRKMLTSISLVDASLATSATYERGDHLIDPRGDQTAAVALSTSVLCADATGADAYSTALAILGPEEAEKLLKRVPVQGALILVEGEDDARRHGNWIGE